MIGTGQTFVTNHYFGWLKMLLMCFTFSKPRVWKCAEVLLETSLVFISFVKIRMEI